MCIHLMKRQAYATRLPLPFFSEQMELKYMGGKLRLLAACHLLNMTNASNNCIRICVLMEEK